LFALSLHGVQLFNTSDEKNKRKLRHGSLIYTQRVCFRYKQVFPFLFFIPKKHASNLHEKEVAFSFFFLSVKKGRRLKNNGILTVDIG
jgi:hypothetical protein